MKPTTARALRQRSTDAEKKLWRILRGKRFAGYKFRRDHPFGPFVLGFYCAEARYNIELDGSQHGFPKGQAADARRDAYLRSRNVQTRRFWNHQMSDVGWVRDIIWAELQARAPHVENVPPVNRTRLPTRVGRKAIADSRPSLQG